MDKSKHFIEYVNAINKEIEKLVLFVKSLFRSFRLFRVTFFFFEKKSIESSNAITHVIIHAMNNINASIVNF